MGFFSGIISLVSSAVSAISGFAKAAISILRPIAQAITTFVGALGLIDPKTKADELGDKAIQAEEAGIKPEKFDTYEKYVKEINNFKLDPAKSQKISIANKLRKGSEVATALAMEKLPNTPIAELISLAAKKQAFFTSATMGVLGSMAKKTPEIIGSVYGYLSGTETKQENLEGALTDITGIFREADPKLSESEAMQKALELRD